MSLLDNLLLYEVQCALKIIEISNFEIQLRAHDLEIC